MDYNTFTKIYTLNENEFLLLATHHDLAYDCNYAWVYTQKKHKFDKKWLSIIKINCLFVISQTFRT
jgi:hypothetical protein